MSKAANTRSEILKKAFELIYQKGYQATSIDDVLATTPVTKGALYYHFKNKEEMGIAVLNEVIYKEIWPFIKTKLNGPGDFRKNIYEMMKGLLLDHPFFKAEYGCPAANLVEEMAPLNEQFRKTLKKQISGWQKAIEVEITKAQQAKQLSTEHDARQISLYILSSYQGARNMGKIYGKQFYTLFLAEFKKYIDSLK